MAKDDYHVIVYQILSYLYVQLKLGKPINPYKINYDGEYFTINESYWKYIMSNLVKEGYVSGVTIKEGIYENCESYLRIVGMEKCQITPKGIEYLSDNSFINKAKDFFKDAKSIVPFV